MKGSRHSHGLRTPAYLLGSLATNTRVVGRGGRVSGVGYLWNPQETSNCARGRMASEGAKGA